VTEWRRVFSGWRIVFLCGGENERAAGNRIGGSRDLRRGGNLFLRGMWRKRKKGESEFTGAASAAGACAAFNREQSGAPDGDDHHADGRAWLV